MCGAFIIAQMFPAITNFHNLVPTVSASICFFHDIPLLNFRSPRGTSENNPRGSTEQRAGIRISPAIISLCASYINVCVRIVQGYMDLCACRHLGICCEFIHDEVFPIGSVVVCFSVAP